MTFNKPSGISTGNLVLSAKNTLWFDYIFGNFLEQIWIGLYFLDEKTIYYAWGRTAQKNK